MTYSITGQRYASLLESTCTAKKVLQYLDRIIVMQNGGDHDIKVTTIETFFKFGL